MKKKLTKLEIIRLKNADLVDYLYEYYHMTTRDCIKDIKERIQKLRDWEEMTRIDSNISADDLNYDLEKFEPEMEEHLQREERVLFPLIKQYEESQNGHYRKLMGCPIKRMEFEHEDHLKNLETIRETADDFRILENFSPEERELIKKLEELYLLTREHIDVENIVLFSRLKIEE